MKRFQVPVSLKNLDESIEFYNALVNTQPTVVKADHAKWMLKDPRIICVGKNAVLGKTMMVILILFFQVINFGFAQNSQDLSKEFKSISPIEDHYERLAALSASGDNVALDSLRFPLKDFRRSAYLKLRTVYLQVPTSFFKIKPFPANSSNQSKAEIAFLLELQAKRSPELMAKTDEMANIYYDPFTNNPTNEDYQRNNSSLFHIGKDLGNWYTPDKLPETTRVLQNVIQDATYYFFNLKADFARPRPYHLSKDIKNPEAPGHSAYPSGHSSASYVNAYLLAEIFPELNNKFLSNAYDMAFSREVRGVHYPSDSRAGKTFAFQFVQQIMKEKSFKSDFEKMKSELETAYKQNGN